MSRSLRQLWDVRERYIKEERGWGGAAGDGEDPDDNHDTHEDNDDDDDENDDDGDSELDSPECIERKVLPRIPPRGHPNLDRRRETDDDDAQERLDTVDAYYVSQQVLGLI